MAVLDYMLHGFRRCGDTCPFDAGHLLPDPFTTLMRLCLCMLSLIFDTEFFYHTVFYFLPRTDTTSDWDITRCGCDHVTTASLNHARID